MSKKIKYKDVLIVIPARLKSGRLPKKLLMNLHGRPLLYWTAKRVLEASLAEVVVATDSTEIQVMCEKYQLPVLLTSEKCINGTERVYEVASKYHDRFELFMNVQGDEPLVNISVIEAVLKTAGIDNNAFKTAISEVHDTSKNNPSEVKVALSKGNRILYASRMLVPFHRDSNGQYYKIHGVYLYSFEVLKKFINSLAGPLEQTEKIEQLRCLENDIPLLGIITPHTMVSVDTETDLDFYRMLDREQFFQN